MENKIICPITQEPIINGGMTCNGQLYEYNEIVKWFEKSSNDPLTGLPLASTFVRKFNINRSADIIEYLIKDARLSYKLWYPFEHEVTIRLDYYQEKLKIKEKFDFSSQIWKDYEIMMSNKFIFGTESEELPMRPKHSGTELDFLNFSNATFENRQFKSRKFIFNNISNTKFISCDLSRVRMIGCELDGTIFQDCYFCGEEVCFYKVSGTFTFINCKIEYTHKWIMTSDPSKFVEILKLRGLKTRKFEVNGNTIIVS